MTDNDIYTLVHTIINMVTGIPGTNIIPADDNECSPAGEYASIKVGQSRGQRGQANITKTNTGLIGSIIGNVRNVNHEVKAQVTVDININFYRGNALENALNLFQANKLPTISDLLLTSKVGWRNEQSINDLTTLQSKEREQRAQLTVTLLYEKTQSIVTNAIYTTSVTVENEDGQQIQTETVNAPIGV